LATSAPAAPVAVSSAPAASLAVSSEVGLYTRAHRLHFDGYAAAALAAWDDYLLQFPDGRFVPDARYNRAIDLIKFRRYTDARAALQPFADGAFGEYHRQDAQRLLRSIP
jgi:TolA-binding protein